jgi:hypothetical protein
MNEMVAQIIRHPLYAEMAMEKLVHEEFDMKLLGSLGREKLKKAYDIFLRNNGREKIVLCDTVDRLYEKAEFDPSNFPEQPGPIDEILFAEISARWYEGIANWTIKTENNHCLTAVDEMSKVKRIFFIENGIVKGKIRIGREVERVIQSNLRPLELGIIPGRFYPDARKEISDQLEFVPMKNGKEKSIHKKVRNWIEAYSEKS